MVATALRARDQGVAVTLSDGTTVEGERLLVATGRRLDLRGLGVDAAGLDPDAPAVATDVNLRAGHGMWAVGDVTGKGAFTHVAVYQGRIATADILGAEHAPADYRAVPRVTFTDPEVASVGLSAAQAREAGLAVRVGVTPTAATARGWIHGPGAEHGVSKLVADVPAQPVGAAPGASSSNPTRATVARTARSLGPGPAGFPARPAGGAPGTKGTRPVPPASGGVVSGIAFLLPAVPRPPARLPCRPRPAADPGWAGHTRAGDL